LKAPWIFALLNFTVPACAFRERNEVDAKVFIEKFTFSVTIKWYIVHVGVRIFASTARDKSPVLHFFTVLKFVTGNGRPI
jgi:hypothetical protein